MSGAPGATRTGARHGAGWLLSLLVLAAVLRSIGLDFGLPYQYASVDESIVADRAMEFLYGDWNPHYFAYPTLWFYVQALTFEAVARVGAWTGAYDSVAAGRLAYYSDPTVHFLAARAVNVLAGVLAVLATFWLGREFGRHFGGGRASSPGAASPSAPLRSPTVLGGLAALVLACNYLHNHIGKFLQLDVPLAFLAAVSITLALRYRRLGRARDLVLAAVVGGLGTSTKYYGALLCLPLSLAVVERAIREGRGPWVVASLRRLMLAAALMVAAFLAGSPYVLLDFARFREDFDFLVRHMEGGHFGQEVAQNGFQVYAQWLWHPWGGVVLCSLAGLGLVAFVRRDRAGGGSSLPAALILLVFPFVYYVMLARMRIHFTGYLAVILPMLAVVAALGLAAVARWLGGTLGRPRLALCLACLPLGLDVVRSVQDSLRFARPDTRVLLRDHVIAHIPSSASIGTDAWLPLPLTEDCLRRMQTQHAAGGDTELLAAIPLTERRSPGYLTARHLEVRRAEAAADPSGRRYDLVQLPATHMSVENLPVMRDSGIRYVVISAARYETLLDNPMRDQPGMLEERPKYLRWIAFYERLLAGDLVVARFPAEGQRAYGPELVLCDLQKLP